MKKSLLLFSFFSLMLNAQEPYPDYQDQWDKVIGYEMERLPKSALQEVNKIYEQAKTDNNAPQIVKALMFQSKFAMLVEEDSQLKVIHNFEKEIAVADFPARPLLESVLANLYWQYFQENRWRFYRRTETEEKANPGDFRTWDLNTIFKEIHTHFNNALAEPKRLQAYELDAFKSIIERRCDTRPNKPTLYDFIARQALKFYQTDETQLTKPAYKYELDNPILLSDAQTFAQLQLTTKDTLSLQFNALKLFQNLMAFHLKDENPEALVALDLERLNFVNEYAVFKNKEELLLQTLEQSRQKLENYPVSTLYDVEIANILRHKGSNYHYKRNPDNQWFLQQAVAICDRAIERFPDSKGGLSCHNIKTSILAPSFNITAEEYIPVNQDSRVLIQYENIESLDFKVLKIDREKALELKEIYKDSVRLALLKKLPVQTTFNTTLKSVGDYQNHSMEGLVPALPHGMYVLFATLPETSAYAYAVIQVTDLTLIEIENRSDQRMQIVNRVNGSPVAGAKVHLQSVDLNRYDKKLDKTYTTDHNGYIYPSAKNHHDYHVIALVSTAEDKAVFGAYYLSNHGDSSPEKRHTYYQTFVFTDRSIYRPGQKLYFKAIVVENKPDGKLTRSRAFPNADVKVTLKDVNWQEIKTLNLTTNAYGSVAGEFMLPDGGLTGRYYIEIEGKRSRINNIHDISVEEYKRPKFETAFKPVEDTYQVDEQVTVKGEAKALAGTAISEAKVMYRVSREVQYPRWWYWYRPDYYSEPQEITHGETTTDARGIYEIKF
ncbi:MAG: alpha-2-macroglobulin, partial [Flavobacteriia bacterium]